jgi:hypothetical protein
MTDPIAMLSAGPIPVGVALIPPEFGKLEDHVAAIDPHPQYASIYELDAAVGAAIAGVPFEAVQTLYVRKGIRASNSNNGTSERTPLLTVAEAAARATPFTLIDVGPGEWREILPMRFRPNVQVDGPGLRIARVGPAPGYETKDIFKVDSGFACNRITFIGHQDGAFAISFNELADNSAYGAVSRGAYILKSPYIQNCSSYTAQDDAGEAGSASTGLTGGGMKVDGLACAVNSPLLSMVVDSFTQINLNGAGCLVCNDGFVQLVSFFGTFCSYHVRAETGGRFCLSGGGTTDFGSTGLQADGYSPRPLYLAKSKFAAYGGERLSEVVTFDLQNNLIQISVPNAIKLGDQLTFVANSGQLPGLNPALSYTVIASGLTSGTFRVSPSGVNGAPSVLTGGQTGVFTVKREGVTQIDIYDVGANRLGRQIKYPTAGTLGSPGNPVTIQSTNGTTPNSFFSVTLTPIAGIRHEYVAGGTLVRDGSTYTITCFDYNNQTGVATISAAGYAPSVGHSITLSGLSFICNSASRPGPGTLMFPQMLFPVGGPTAYTYTRLGSRVLTYQAPAAPNGPTHEYVSGGSCVISGQDYMVERCTYNKGTGLVTVTTKKDIPATGTGTVTIGNLRFIYEESRYIVRSALPIDANGGAVANNSPNKAGYRVDFFNPTNRGLKNSLAADQVLDFRNRSQGLAPAHTFEWAGSGTNYDAFPENGGLPVRGSEILETRGGRIFYTSVNEVGDYNVGGVFTVDGTTGELTLSAPSVNLGSVNAIGPFSRDGGFSKVGEQLREISNNPDLIASTGQRDGNTAPTQSAVFNFTGSRFLSNVVGSNPLIITGLPVQDGSGNWSYIKTVGIRVGKTPDTVAAGNQPRIQGAAMALIFG